MSELDPVLKRLFQWSRAAAPAEPAAAPFGFADRVLTARRSNQAPTLFQELQRAAWGLSWASLVLIVCGGLVLAIQSSTPASTGEFSSALSYLATNLSP